MHSRPACQTCRGEGVQCPGYPKSIRWSAKHEVFNPVPPRSTPPDSAVEQPRGIQSEQASSRLTAPTGHHLDEAQKSRFAHDPQRLPLPVAFAEPDPVWPDFDACTYQALGLSSDWLMELDFQYPFQEPLSFGVTDKSPDPNQANTGDTSKNSTGNFSSPPTPRFEGSATRSSPSKSLLQTYYRLSGPGQVLGLTDEAFVEYYFENVCALYSCFDSAKNPFRSVVEREWTKSPAMFLTIQSMAIGHLTNFYPTLGPLGLQKRSQAWEYLQRDLRTTRIGTRSDDVLLMNLLLLGMSSAWHQSSNLGMQYILIAREIMQRRLQSTRSGRTPPAQHTRLDDDFLGYSLLYWEMLISWIDPVPLAPLYVRLDLPSPVPPHITSPTMPHPCTGVVSEVHFALAEIGRVVRRQQSQKLSLHPRQFESSTSESSNRRWAASLENFLHAIELPQEEQIIDYDDLKTSKPDLITIADVYRRIGLLELYRLYPDLLRSRIEHSSGALDTATLITDTNQHETADTHPERLCVLAYQALELAKPIVITAGVCRLLPLVLLIAGSYLRLFEGNTLAQQLSREDVILARYLVEARLLVLSRKYPQKPLLQMMDIMKEVWSRLDPGGDPKNAHWMEVMHELNWQTIMG